MKKNKVFRLIKIMNLTALSQLIALFVIVLVGPASIAYFAYKKAL